MFVSYIYGADNSIFEMFWAAAPIIKIIMIGLFIASLWSWTIIIHKVVLFRKIIKQSDRFEDKFWDGQSLDNLYKEAQKIQGNPLISVFMTAMHEWKKTAKSISMQSLESKQSFINRLERTMNADLQREVDDLERHFGFLSSLGTNGVIIGLFGTVIGIMNSFQAIAHHQNTSLAIVAPGIAEALFATSLGLAAAIPAALAYNKFLVDIQHVNNRIKCFIDDFLCFIERQLNEE